jgi:lantibiotic modifying enzyme
MRGHAAAGEAADLGAEWLLDQASPAASGTSLTWPMAGDDPTVWHWWCHGAPGVGLAFLERYRWTDDEDDAGVARACLRTHPWHVRAANLSHCHGLAGWAETLLEGHEVLGDRELLDDARQLASVLEDLAMEAGTGVAWRVESPHYFDADLLTGGAGILHLLARVGRPSSPGFGLPLIDG